MHPQIPVVSQAPETSTANDENGGVVETLAMAVEDIDVGIAKRVPGALEDSDNEVGDGDPRVDDLIESAGMGGFKRDLDVTIGWTVFSTPALYDDDDDG